jgi:hypothetical protein
MIVVSDTSPLNYLVLIDLQHILPEFVRTDSDPFGSTRRTSVRWRT